MIDEYMKQIESIISPKKHCIENISNNVSERNLKIIKTETNDYLVDRSTNSLNNENSGKSKDFRNCNDLNILKEIINQEKKKNMVYRHDINELNKKIESLEKIINDQDKKINNFEKENELNRTYILKLEGMINHINKNNLTKSAKVLNSVKTDENYSMNFLTEENENLKKFKNKIYELSTIYDDINGNIINNLNDIQELLININDFYMNNQNSKSFDLVNLEKLKSKFENTIVGFESSLKSKQYEYNFLLEQKDKENQIITDELIRLKKNNDALKIEKLNEYLINGELETRLELSTRKLQEYENVNNTDITSKPNEFSKKNIVKKSTNVARKSIDNSLKKLKNNLDLKDSSNLRLLEKINNQFIV